VTRSIACKDGVSYTVWSLNHYDVTARDAFERAGGYAAAPAATAAATTATAAGGGGGGGGGGDCAALRCEVVRDGVSHKDLIS